MRTLSRSLRPLVAAFAIAGLASCASYVKRDEFDATVAELRAADQAQSQRIDQLQASLEERFRQYDARIAQFEGRLHVETTAHFDYGKADVREADKPMLADFAKTLSEHHQGVVVTVEGFTDPAGSASFNKRLGQRRADAVRDFLVSQGLSADQVRAVSYGEANNRQIRPGAWGDDGLANRRVALVIDFVEAVAAR
ncbi:OmpA family protein [Arenimonas caeni]|jgi:peptidoglycan-associated lipoprotein|uniref:OmpA family protein n=1 Tax=Arenimonas caeni TaxID=2058085 RepID=UPI002A368AC9|nr:OmpA family protein [Arenimonas caeni]MDY0022845.1 OmpA family protein [Arenimonas caeni]